MKRLVLIAIVVMAFACPAHADVTVKMTTRGPALGPGPGGRGGAGTIDVPATYYIKNGKARIDTIVGGREMSTILDPAAGQMITLDPETRVATIYDLSKLGEQVQQSVQMGDTKVSMTPTGRTKDILGRACTEYQLSMTVPMKGGPGAEGDMTMTMSGPVWIAKDAPGTADFAAFYKAAANSPLFAAGGGRGRGRGGSPGMTSGMAAMYNAFGEAGGIPYEQHLQVKMEGSGPMADMMRGRGAPPETVTMVTSVTTDPIRDDRFAIPDGYTKRNQ